MPKWLNAGIKEEKKGQKTKNEKEKKICKEEKQLMNILSTRVYVNHCFFPHQYKL